MDHRSLPAPSPFPPGKGPFRQKGNVYRTLMVNLDRYVDGGAAAVLARLEDEADRAFLSQPFVAGGWYDIFPMTALVVETARMLGIPYFKAVSDLARMMAEADMNGVYRALLRVVSPEFLAPRLPRIQAAYLDFGGVRVGVSRRGYCEIFRTGHPLCLVHWYVAVAHGFLPLILTQAGASDVRVRWDEPSPDGRRDGFALAMIRFELQWT